MRLSFYAALLASAALVANAIQLDSSAEMHHHDTASSEATIFAEADQKLVSKKQSTVIRTVKPNTKQVIKTVKPTRVGKA